MSSTTHAGGHPRRNRRPKPAAAAAVRAPATTPAATTPAATTPAAAEASPFEGLGVPAPLAAALRDRGVTVPFPIQAATLPDALAGRDILGRAQTGSGKTIAFAVPVVATLRRQDDRRSPGRPRALILVPTRELAAQVSRAVAPLAAAVGLRCATIHGGVPQGPQVAALRRGVDIIVATPGRLEDLIDRGHCHLDSIRATVLDEADHLADLGFLPAVRRLLDQTPSGGQRLLFSATLDDAIAGLADRYLHRPVRHTIDPAEAAPAPMDHHLFSVRPADKAAVVAELASGQRRSLLFTRTKHGARKLAHQLSAAGIPAVDLHANLAQAARQRNLAAFADGTARVLVATDIAARGVHVDDVALVVHVDPPAEHKAYLHRSGRTARAGATGTVVTIATADQTRDVTALLRKAHVRASIATVVPGDPRTTALTGPPAPRRPNTASPNTTTASRPAPRRPNTASPNTTTGSQPAGRPGRHAPVARGNSAGRRSRPGARRRAAAA